MSSVLQSTINTMVCSNWARGDHINRIKEGLALPQEDSPAIGESEARHEEPRLGFRLHGSHDLHTWPVPKGSSNVILKARCVDERRRWTHRAVVKTLWLLHSWAGGV